MLFNYKALDERGEEKSGSIEAVNADIAISSLQRRGLIISQIKAEEEESLLGRKFSFSIEFQIKISSFFPVRWRRCLKLKFRRSESFSLSPDKLKNPL